MHFHLIAFLAACAVVLLLTPLINELGLKTGCVDQPNARKIHNRPMVRLGGVSIFAGNIVALLLVWNAGGFAGMPQNSEYEIWGVTLGGVAFFLIGLADDLFTLPALGRLIAQFAVAAIVWGVGVKIRIVTIPFLGGFDLGSLSLPITSIWLVGMANAINFIDGVDGLAAGVSGIAAISMFFVCLFLDEPEAALLAAALAGGALGFLRYNFNPARIFMGDGGAYFMGFTLAGIGVVGLVKGYTTMAILAPLMILAVPIIDTSTVILNRLRQGLSPFTADKRHLHHRLLQAGLSQRSTVLFIYTLTLWVGSFAMGMAGLPGGMGYFLGATGLLCFACWYVWKRVQPPGE
ncbi:undecaprenyl/decaprenyl-phosphate alpha-N-acetylglucosaminyl 1-phosphate transferase [Candidatus Synechococcus calcipolaris G9]|uniref:Undecaprenyl/decaprenyl-phosphate alpha-N-acetylglucosaminyl 1-phosphate transferase n=1 Tax=Candidatus Synechococcus calcipolaris G9 TaxID=1497997 RepID=A0ABT6F0A8_9SYNE|nr:MraY family glycosyltransferase [Candidatus Synechococcus calcipolaris]MDG2991275.1 undecaprenyl/decaprenyl-phosphate alpha-N-acetylglucosaminyl 1-phosphate transferase [Candidatus Synechococcus calcipolaris G9]